MSVQSRIERLERDDHTAACIWCGATPGREYIDTLPVVEVTGDPDSIGNRTLIEEASLGPCPACGASPRVAVLVVVWPAEVYAGKLASDPRSLPAFGNRNHNSC